MGKVPLVVLDETLVVHRLMPVLLPHIEPLPRRGNRNTAEVLEAELLVLLNLIGLLRAQLLSLVFPRLFQRDPGSDFPHQSAVNLTI